MGIPRLTSHLSPFATHTVMGCSKTDCATHSKSYKIIIDGPALAYHIFHRVLACRSSALNALDAQPSYNELGKATLLYLSELQRHNVVIEKIYFDGFLPPRKRTVRISRLESYLKQLITFRSLHSNGVRCQEITSDASNPTAQELFDCCKSLANNYHSLPASPFLVPAILDTLSTSAFASIVEVIPAEADSFCADAARKLDGVVLTSDSDLLVHDLGIDGGVIFFKQLGLQTAADSGCHVVAAPTFRPFAIAKQLDVINVSRLAFELKTDSTITLLEAVRRTRQSPDDVPAYKDFLVEYTRSGSSAGIPTSLHGSSSSVLRRMDPRISELVLQYYEPGDEIICVYLPFLIDDPSRISAWDVSLDLRYFAYSLLSHDTTTCRKSTIIHEYGRRGKRIMYHEVRTISSGQCIHFAKIMFDRLMAIQTILHDMPEYIHWRVFSMLMVVCWYVDSGRTPPSDADLLVVLRGAYVNTIRWEVVHLTTQSQAVLYAFRFIQKIIEYLVYHTSTTLNKQLMELWEVLQELPSLEKTIPFRHELLKEPGSELEPHKILELVKEIAGFAVSPPQEARNQEIVQGVEPSWTLSKRQPTRKRKQNSHMSKKPSVDLTKQTNNMYSVLAKI